MVADVSDEGWLPLPKPLKISKMPMQPDYLNFSPLSRPLTGFMLMLIKGASMDLLVERLEETGIEGGRLSSVEAYPAVRGIYVDAQEWSREFEEQVWNRGGERRPSFHNAGHLMDVGQAMGEYFETIEEADPLNVRREFMLWNQRHPEAYIYQGEQLEVFLLAAAIHDLGNFIGSLKAGSPVFLDTYRAKNAENRSERLAEEIIANSGLEQSKKSRFLPLIKHLIDQSKYSQIPTAELFNRSMQVFDQIGSHAMHRDGAVERVEGLLWEMLGENPNTIINPATFFNFVPVRLPQLLSQAQVEDIRSIWKIPPLRLKPDYEDRRLTVGEYMRQRKAS